MSEEKELRTGRTAGDAAVEIFDKFWSDSDDRGQLLPMIVGAILFAVFWNSPVKMDNWPVIGASFSALGFLFSFLWRRSSDRARIAELSKELKRVLKERDILQEKLGSSTKSSEVL
jgi:hypothetical protein